MLTFLNIVGMIMDFIKEVGINLTILIVLCYGGFKLFTNHLKHIKDKQNCMDKKLGQVKKNVVQIQQSLAVRTAICEERHKADKK